MRKFKLIDGSYGNLFSLGLTYDSDYVQIESGKKVLDLFYMYPGDWKEVFEPESKPLHKDTDLGYFAGLVFKACFNDLKNGDWSNENIAIHSIEAAKELIKQLNEETK